MTRRPMAAATACARRRALPVVARGLLVRPDEDAALDSLERCHSPPTTDGRRPRRGAGDHDSASRRRVRGRRAGHRQLPARPRCPAGRVPAGTSMREIQERGCLRVGVDENTLGFSYRELRHRRDRGLRGRPRPRDRRADLRRPTTADRRRAGPGRTRTRRSTSSRTARSTSPISAISMSLRSLGGRRVQQPSTTPRHQQFLVRRDSDIDDVGDLAGQTVCVTAIVVGRILEKHVPEAVLSRGPGRTDCLVALQEGDVDAYFGHDSFLYGMLQPGPDRRGQGPGSSRTSHAVALRDRHRPGATRARPVRQRRARGAARPTGRGPSCTTSSKTRRSLPARRPPAAEYRD